MCQTHRIPEEVDTGQAAGQDVHHTHCYQSTCTQHQAAGTEGLTGLAFQALAYRST
jgi:hypothetical protein